MFILAAMLALADTPPGLSAKFDLLCKGTNTITLPGRKSETISYEDRISIDLAAELFSDADHTSPTHMAQLTDQLIVLHRTLGPDAKSDLSLDRFNSVLSGETDYVGGGQIDLSAKCQRLPFTQWDHRAF